MTIGFPTSFNNRVVLEAYKTDKSLRTTVSNGFAMVEQKVVLKGLRVLVGATINHGGESTLIPAGSTAYVKEELLHNQAWATKKLKCEFLGDKEFIVVDSAHIEFFTPPEGPAA